MNNVTAVFICPLGEGANSLAKTKCPNESRKVTAAIGRRGSHEQILAVEQLLGAGVTWFGFPVHE